MLSTRSIACDKALQEDSEQEASKYLKVILEAGLGEAVSYGSHALTYLFMLSSTLHCSNTVGSLWCAVLLPHPEGITCFCTEGRPRASQATRAC